MEFKNFFRAFILVVFAYTVQCLAAAVDIRANHKISAASINISYTIAIDDCQNLS